MAITLIKTGKNAGKYRVRIQPTDSRIGKTIYIPSKIVEGKRKAKLLEQQMLANFHSKNSSDFNNINKTLVEGLEEYIRIEHESGRWADATTFKDWKYAVKLVKNYFGKMKIKDVREKDIRNFARNYVVTHHTTVGPQTTVDWMLQILRSYFTTLKDDGLQKNPVPMRPLSKFFRKDEMTVPLQKYVFSNKEIKELQTKIINELPNIRINYWTTRLAILIALDTGMRPQEIQALKWTNIVSDNEYKVFSINNSWNEKARQLNEHLKSRPRGFSRLTLPLSEPLLQLLKQFHQGQMDFLKEQNISNFNNFILLNIKDYRLCEMGYPITQKGMNDMLKKQCKLNDIDGNGLRLSMYTCRHTVATKLGNTPGMSYPWAASRLGHSLKMFMRTYVHVDQDRSANMLKLMSQYL